MVISSCTSYVMARVLGCPVSVCGSICKINLCLIVLSHITAERNILSKRNFLRPPDPKYFLSSQITDVLGFNSQIPDFLGLYSLIPDADSSPL